MFRKSGQKKTSPKSIHAGPRPSGVEHAEASLFIYHIQMNVARDDSCCANHQETDKIPGLQKAAILQILEKETRKWALPKKCARPSSPSWNVLASFLVKMNQQLDFHTFLYFVFVNY